MHLQAARADRLSSNVYGKHPDNFGWSPTRCKNCRQDEFLARL